MANWSDLKAAVAEVIKTNGNNEITGQILQDTLNSIISNVGANATLVGVATPTTNPGSPDGNVFYFATQAGTYTNFGSVVLNEGLNILLWNGTSWTVTNVMTIVQDLGNSENAVISQKTVTEEITDIKSNVTPIYLSELLEYTTSTGLITNDGSLDTRSTHAVINVDGTSRVRLVGKYDKGMTPNLYAFYNSTTPSASSLCGTIFRLDTTSEYDLYADVPDGAVILVVNMTKGSLTPYKLTPISYSLPNKIENLEQNVEEISDITLQNVLKLVKVHPGRESQSIDALGDLDSRFNHYTFNVESVTRLRLVGGMAGSVPFGAFYNSDVISSENLVQLFKQKGIVNENQYDITLEVPNGAKIFVLNDITSSSSSGFQEADTFIPVSYQFPNKIEEIEEETENMPIYEFNLEDFMYRDEEESSSGNIYWHYNVLSVQAVKIMGLKDGFDELPYQGKISFYDSGEILLKEIEYTEIEDEYIDIPSGAVDMVIFARYTQRNSFFVYKATKVDSTLRNHVNYLTKLMLDKDINFVKTRDLLKLLSESVSDGAYMDFSDKEDLELLHNTPCDTGQNFTINGDGNSSIGITDGHVNYEEVGTPNFYMELKSKFHNPMNFMSCKIYKTGGVFLLGREDDWSAHMIHLIFNSPESIEADTGYLVSPAVRNDDSGENDIRHVFREVYGENIIAKSDANDDHIYEYVVYVAGEFIYIISPANKLLVLQNISDDEYHKNAAILQNSTSALWQRGNFTEVCCGIGQCCHIAMRYAYRIKKLFNL